MTVVRWTFYDPTTLVTYTVPINPNDGGSPSYQKSIARQMTTAPDGKTLLFEGADQVQTLEFSGVLIEQAHYDAFVTWFNKRHQVKVTDDLQRTFWIYITGFAPKRQRAAKAPWKHQYSVSALILDI
jgi:hypothetical protein